MTTPPERDVTSLLEAALDPDFEQRHDWKPEELGALLAHQWSAPLEADLDALPPEQARVLKQLGDAEGLLRRSYGELFTHPLPPVEILEAIKDYAKRNLTRPSADLPEEIARALYVLSVVVARYRCGQRITSQSDETVRASVQAFLAQPWVIEPVKTLLREGLSALVTESDLSGADREASRGG